MIVFSIRSQKQLAFFYSFKGTYLKKGQSPREKNKCALSRSTNNSSAIEIKIFKLNILKFH